MILSARRPIGLGVWHAENAGECRMATPAPASISPYRGPPSSLPARAVSADNKSFHIISDSNARGITSAFEILPPSDESIPRPIPIMLRAGRPAWGDAMNGMCIRYKV